MLNLFTYGTLRKGGGLNSKLDGLGQFIGTYHSLPKYSLYDMGCPCLSAGGETSVVGDIYQIEDLSQIAHIHNIEVRAGYHLEKVELDNFAEPVYSYFQTPNKEWNAPLIVSGDWLRYRDTSRYETEDRTRG